MNSDIATLQNILSGTAKINIPINADKSAGLFSDLTTITNELKTSLRELSDIKMGAGIDASAATATKVAVEKTTDSINKQKLGIEELSNQYDQLNSLMANSSLSKKSADYKAAKKAVNEYAKELAKANETGDFKKIQDPAYQKAMTERLSGSIAALTKNAKNIQTIADTKSELKKTLSDSVKYAGNNVREDSIYKTVKADLDNVLKAEKLIKNNNVSPEEAYASIGMQPNRITENAQALNTYAKAIGAVNKESLSALSKENTDFITKSAARGSAIGDAIEERIKFSDRVVEILNDKSKKKGTTQNLDRAFEIANEEFEAKYKQTNASGTYKPYTRETFMSEANKELQAGIDYAAQFGQVSKMSLKQYDRMSQEIGKFLNNNINASATEEYKAALEQKAQLDNVIAQYTKDSNTDMVRYMNQNNIPIDLLSKSSDSLIFLKRKVATDTTLQGGVTYDQVVKARDAVDNLRSQYKDGDFLEGDATKAKVDSLSASLNNLVTSFDATTASGDKWVSKTRDIASSTSDKSIASLTKELSNANKEAIASSEEFSAKFMKLDYRNSSLVGRYKQAQFVNDSDQQLYDSLVSRGEKIKEASYIAESEGKSYKEALTRIVEGGDADKFLKETKKDVDAFSNSVKGKLVPGMADYEQKMSQVSVLGSQVTRDLQKFTKAKTGKSSAAYAELESYYKDLDNLSGKIAEGTVYKEEATAEYNRIKQGIYNSRQAIIEQGEDQLSLQDKLGNLVSKFGSWYAVSQGIMLAGRAMKSAVSNVVNLDTAMTELKKVTDESDASYTNFTVNAGERAKKVGATMTDVVSATADFARLGYSMTESSTIADAALIYKNVGDGITDVGEASESIISTMQAFGIEANNSIDIVNKFNAVGNKYAVSSSGIGQSLVRSASALAFAGNSLDESIGLIAGANEIVQNPEKIGTALKTISLRLRGAKTELQDAGEDTDGMANSVSSLRSEILALTSATDNPVDIMINDTEFKSTTQMLREIAAAWQDLTDIQQASMLELIAGKTQANVAAALIQNWSQVENAINTSAYGSTDSAIIENQKQLDSIQGRMNVLKASWEDLSNTVVGSDLLKFGLSAGTTGLDALNFVGKNLGTGTLIGGLLGGVFPLFAKAMKQDITTTELLSALIPNSVKNLASAAKSKVISKGSSLKAKASGLAGLLGLGEESSADNAAVQNFVDNAEQVTEAIDQSANAQARQQAELAASAAQAKNLSTNQSKQAKQTKKATEAVQEYNDTVEVKEAASSSLIETSEQPIVSNSDVSNAKQLAESAAVHSEKSGEIARNTETQNKAAEKNVETAQKNASEVSNVADTMDDISKSDPSVIINPNSVNDSQKIVENLEKAGENSEKIESNTSKTVNNNEKSTSAATSAISNLAGMVKDVGLNMLAGAAAGFAVDWASKGIDYVLHGYENALAQSKQLAESSRVNAETTLATYSSLQGIAAEYTRISNTNLSATEKTDQLTALQNSYKALTGEEFASIDLINGQYQQNIDLLQQKLEVAQSINNAAIKEAQNNAKTDFGNYLNRVNDSSILKLDKNTIGIKSTDLLDYLSESVYSKNIHRYASYTPNDTIIPNNDVELTFKYDINGEEITNPQQYVDTAYAVVDYIKQMPGYSYDADAQSVVADILKGASSGEGYLDNQKKLDKAELTSTLQDIGNEAEICGRKISSLDDFKNFKEDFDKIINNSEEYKDIIDKTTLSQNELNDAREEFYETIFPNWAELEKEAIADENKKQIAASSAEMLSQGIELRRQAEQLAKTEGSNAEEIARMNTDGAKLITDSYETSAENVKSHLDAFMRSEDENESQVLSNIKALAKASGEISADQVKELAAESKLLSSILENDGMSCEYLASVLSKLVLDPNNFNIDSINASMMALDSALYGYKNILNEADKAGTAYQTALDAGSKSDGFKLQASAMSVLNEELQAGRTNSNEFWAAAEYAFGEDNLDKWNWDPAKIAEMGTNYKRIFSDAKNSGMELLAVMAETYGDGNIYATAEDGLTDINNILGSIKQNADGTFDFNLKDFDFETIKEIANDLNISPSAVTNAFRAIDEYSDLSFIDPDIAVGAIEMMDVAIGKFGATKKSVFNASDIKDFVTSLGGTARDSNEVVSALEAQGHVVISATDSAEKLKNAFAELGKIELNEDGLIVSTNGISDFLTECGLLPEEVAAIMYTLQKECAEGVEIPIKTKDETKDLSLADQSKKFRELDSALIETPSGQIVDEAAFDGLKTGTNYIDNATEKLDAYNKTVQQTKQITYDEAMYDGLNKAAKETPKKLSGSGLVTPVEAATMTEEEIEQVRTITVESNTEEANAKLLETSQNIDELDGKSASADVEVSGVDDAKRATSSTKEALSEVDGMNVRASITVSGVDNAQMSAADVVKSFRELEEQNYTANVSVEGIQSAVQDFAEMVKSSLALPEDSSVSISIDADTSAVTSANSAIQELTANVEALSYMSLTGITGSFSYVTTAVQPVNQAISSISNAVNGLNSKSVNNLVRSIASISGVAHSSVGAINSVASAARSLNGVSVSGLVGQLSSISGTASSAASMIRSIASALDALNGKNVTTTVTTKHVTVGGSTFSSPMATAVGGTIPAAARGDNFSRGGQTLVGELGPELVRSGKKSFLVGKNGPEIVYLKRGDQVFNHLQTKEILKSGGINSPRLVYPALAGGTGGNILHGPIPAMAQVSGTGVGIITYPGGLGSSTSVNATASSVQSAASQTADAVNSSVDAITEATEEAAAVQTGTWEEMLAQHKAMVASKQETEQEYFDWYKKAIIASLNYGGTTQDGWFGLTTTLDDDTISTVKKNFEIEQAIHDYLKGTNQESLGDYTKWYLDYEGRKIGSGIYTEAEYWQAKLKMYQVEQENLAQQWTDAIAELDHAISMSQYDTYAHIARLKDKYEYLTQNVEEAWNTGKLSAEDYKQVLEDINDLSHEIANTEFDAWESWMDRRDTRIEKLMDSDLVNQYSKYNTEMWGTVYQIKKELERLIVEEGAQWDDERVEALMNRGRTAMNTIHTYQLNVAKDAQSQAESLFSYYRRMRQQDIDDQKEALDKEYNEFKKNLDKQKELLKRQKDDDDYIKNQTKKRKTVSDIQIQLQQLSMDTSAAAGKKRIELMQELYDAQDDLDEYEKDRAYELAVRFLDDEEEAYVEAYETKVDELNDALSSMGQLYDEFLEEMRDHSEELFEQLKEWNYEYGDGIVANIVDAWDEAYSAFTNYADVYKEFFEGIDDMKNSQGGTSDLTGWNYDDDPFILNSTANKDLQAQYEALIKAREEAAKKAEQAANSVSETYDTSKTPSTSGITNETTISPNAAVIDDTSKSSSSSNTSTSATKLEVGSKIKLKAGTKYYETSWGGGNYGTVSKETDATIQIVSPYDTSTHPYSVNGWGWIRKSDIVGYRKGTNYAQSGIAMIDEEGDETIFASKDGSKYRMFSSGEKVLNASASNFLYNFATNGQDFFRDMFKSVGEGIKAVVSGDSNPVNISMGDIIINGNADQQTVSQIRRAQRDNLDYVLRNLGKLKAST